MGKIKELWGKEMDIYNQIQKIKDSILETAKEIQKLEDMIGKDHKVD